MNFDFSDDLKSLRDQARKFLRERNALGAARRVIDGAGSYDKALWQEIADMGWIGAAIPEEYGGAGLGHLGLCVLAEELGHALAPVPFSSSVYLASEALLHRRQRGAEEALAADARVRRGDRHLGARRRSRRGRRQGVARQRRRSPPERHKLPVPDGDIADLAIVAARGERPAERGLSLFLVDLTASACGARWSRPSIPAARMRVSPSRARRPSRWARPGEGLPLLRRLFDRAAVLFAFEQVGGAEAALEMARDYALERYAFGRPIGSFQAIKHKLADVYVAHRAGALQRLLRRLGAVARTRPSCRSPPPRRASRRARPSRWPPRRTSRPMAAWASPGSSTATSTTAAPSCWRWRSAARATGRIASSPISRRATTAGLAARSASRLSSERQHGLRRHARRSRVPHRSARLPRRQRRAAPSPAPPTAIAPARARRARSSAPRRGRRRRPPPAIAGITWPKEWGGRGGTPIQQVIYDQEEANYVVPRGFFEIGLGMCIPTLMHLGHARAARALRARRRCAARRSGASSSPSPPPAPTSPACARAPSATATTG